MGDQPFLAALACTSPLASSDVRIAPSSREGVGTAGHRQWRSAMATATMSEATTTTSERVHRLLATARETMGKVRYCWAVTASEYGGANARPMGRIPGPPGGDEWTVWFLTSSDSRKAAENPRDRRIPLSYPQNSAESYVTRVGSAALVGHTSAILSPCQETPKV